MEELEETRPVQHEPAEAGDTPQDAQLATQGQGATVWRTVGIILAVLAVVLVGSAVFYGLASHPMFTAVLRDISIIVLALVTMITSILLAVLLFQLQSLIVLLRDEVQPILQSINETTGTVRGTTTFVSDAVVNPVIEVAGYVAGVRTTISTLFRGPRRESTSATSVQPDSRAAGDDTEAPTSP
jgi:hypothetical protein